MPDYVLQISIQGQRAMQQLAQQGYRICFASAIADEGFKIIASSIGKSTCVYLLTLTNKWNSDLAPNARIQWNDEFSIAASQSSFMNGGMGTTNLVA